MGSRREQALLVVLVAMAVLIAFVAAPDADRNSLDLRASTMRPAEPGAFALYRTLDALEIPVEQRLTDWVDGPPLGGTLVLLAPAQVLTPREVETLVDWIEEGGALVLAGGRFVQEDLLEALGLRLMPIGGGEPQTALRDEEHPWTSEEAWVDGFEWAFAPEAPALADAGAVTLLSAGNPRRPVVIALRREEGRVVAWSDVGPLTNGELRESRAAVLFARAAADLVASQAPLVFDEYHHGYREGIGPARATFHFLRDTRPGWMALQWTVAVLGLVWLYGRRFGAPYEPPPARRRSPLEHVDALAGAYERGGAHLTARRLVVAGLARRLGVPVPPAGTEDAWIDQHGRRSSSARAHADAMRVEWQRDAKADLAALARHADAIAADRT